MGAGGQSSVSDENKGKEGNERFHISPSKRTSSLAGFGFDDTIKNYNSTPLAERKLFMPQIHFLSQNRPGPRMGMGHYERLLIETLGRETSPKNNSEWQFNITFEGRKPNLSLPRESLETTLDNTDFLGYSTARLAKLPFAAATALLNLRFRDKPAVYHSLGLSFPLPNNAPGVFTIHDLPPARFSDEGQLAFWAKKAAQSARFVMTPSHFAKAELVELLDLSAEKVIVVPYGCEHDRYHPDVVPAPATQLKSWGIKGEFLLYAGGFTRRKNVAALLEAWKQIAPDYPDLTLVLAGPQAKLTALAKAAAAPRVWPMGYVPHGQMPALMKAARALVFPSIYEGFGLPPQEAMALGVPVIISAQGGATPEVVGDAGVTALDGSAAAIAGAMRQLLDDEALQAQLKIAGPQRVARFSWQEHARQVLEVYRRAMEG